MKFNLLDRVEAADGTKLVGYKSVSLAEEYLADHFPTFPVLPGVMMLEALVQAATWVVHLREDFKFSVVVLKEARNVRYGTFLAPGMTLRAEVELIGAKPGVIYSFKGTGTTGGQIAVTARLDVAAMNLADQQPHLQKTDSDLREYHRKRWALIRPEGGVALTAGA